MNATQLVGFGMNLSMWLMVFSVALNAGDWRARLLFREPALLLRSLVAMYVVMPLFAAWVALNFELDRALLVALILLALSPVPPLLPSKQIKAGGSTNFVIGLLVVAALAAIAVVPGGVAAAGRLFGQDLQVPMPVTARVVGTSVLLPVIAGLVVARIAPALAGRIAGPIAAVSGVLLLLLFIPVVAMKWSVLQAQLGNYTVGAILLFIGVGLVAGHLLGGPDPENRTALALATATRHPGVAVAVLRVLSPEAEDVVPVVLLYLLVGMVASLPYIKWRTRKPGAVKERSR
jgi:BASS family bile acid:Na+ symporter